MSLKGMKTNEFFYFIRMILFYTLVQHTVSLLLDRHFVMCLPPQLLFYE